VRVFLVGPRWRRLFGVIGLLYDLEPDVREQILEELRPDVVAIWTDPREQLGLP